MTTEELNGQISCAEYELMSAFQQWMALACEEKSVNVELEKVRETAFLRHIGEMDETFVPYAARFYRQLALLGRSYRRDCAVEPPMAAALRIIGAKTAPIMNADAFLNALSYALRSVGINPRGKKALVLGAGEEAEALSEMLVALGAAGANVSTPEDASAFTDAALLVNASSVGACPENGVSPVKLEAFPQCRGVLDFISDPLRTALVLNARARGIPAAGGLSVVAAMAANATGRFTGPAPDEAISELCAEIESARGNIVLIGTTGCAEEAKALAKRTGREIINLDDEIENAAEKPVSLLLQEDGEPVYRFFERRAAAKAGALKGVVIAAGTGVVTDRRNFASLHQNGFVFWLKTPEMYEEVPESIKNLEAEHALACHAFANAELVLEKTPDETVEAVLRAYRAYFGVK